MQVEIAGELVEVRCTVDIDHDIAHRESIVVTNIYMNNMRFVRIESIADLARKAINGGLRNPSLASDFKPKEG